MSKYNHLTKPDPQGIHVIDRHGDLKWLEAPFSAYCLDDIGSIKANTLVYVEEVAMTLSNELVYIVGNKFYSHSHFIVDSSY